MNQRVTMHGPTDTLYFLETECAERHIKIGISSNVSWRIDQMQGCCPYRIRLIKRVPGAAHMEKGLHRKFAADRLIGEWFRRTPELLALINSMDGFDDVERPEPTLPTPVIMPELPPSLGAIPDKDVAEAFRKLRRRAEYRRKRSTLFGDAA